MGTGAQGNAIREALQQIDQEAYQTGNPLINQYESAAIKPGRFSDVKE